MKGNPSKIQRKMMIENVNNRKRKKRFVADYFQLLSRKFPTFFCRFFASASAATTLSKNPNHTVTKIVAANIE